MKPAKMRENFGSTNHFKTAFKAVIRGWISQLILFYSRRRLCRQLTKYHQSSMRPQSWVFGFWWRLLKKK